MKTVSLLCSAVLASAMPAFAAVTVTVTAPLTGAQVTSPFQLVATASPCSSQAISAMGYSLDNSSNTTIVNGIAVNAQVTAATGTHVLHVKSWGNQGASCVTDVSINVVVATVPVIPATAIAVNAMQSLTNWQASFDTGTGGSSATSSGVMSLTATPSLSGTARQFATSYTNYGGERYYVDFGADVAPTNFVYDGWVYIANSAAGIANIEMDLNQVLSNGQTVIYGFQCDGWSKTWDYTANTGTPQNFNDTWLHSTQACNPQTWTLNTWHHVQISFTRDSVGNVTYHSVWLDGVQQPLNVTVNSAFALGWASSLITNFQIDGSTSTAGSSTVYLDKLVVYRW